jgi:hypothetical protein
VTARPTKFFAVLLAALLGASGGVASFAACPHATREARAQPARHDCCPAQRARADGHDAESTHAHHAAAHAHAQGAPEVSRRQSHEAGSAAHHDDDSARGVSQAEANSPCADCCAPLLAASNTPAVAPARGESRDDDADDATAPQTLTHAAPHRRELAPTQHAPPAPRPRPHALNSVLLI